MKRDLLRSAGLCIALVAFSGAAHAKWPERPVTIVAPWAPGGNADILARLTAQSISDKLGQPVIVENRPGAGGMLGAQTVARSKADGYTFLLGAFAHVLGQFFYRNKLVDMRTELIPVTQVVDIPNYIAVNSNSKYTSLKELLEEAKADPSKVTCATPGVGTAAHLVCEMINQEVGTKIETVPYRGGVPAITDVMGGLVTFYSGNESLPYIKDNRLKGLAVTTLERSPVAEDLPPAADDIPGFSVGSWYGVFAPTGTPKEAVDRMSTLISEALTDQEFINRLNDLGANPIGSTPEEFGVFVDSELTRWEAVTKSLDIRLD